jgi:hypothetical protein
MSIAITAAFRILSFGKRAHGMAGRALAAVAAVAGHNVVRQSRAAEDKR